MGALTTGALGTLIGIAGAITGAPLVAFLNHAYLERKELAENRRKRISVWRELLQRATDHGPSYDFRNTNEYSSLEIILLADVKNSVTSLLGPDVLIGDEKDYWPGLLPGNHSDVMTMLRSEISRIERSWGLI